MLASNHRSQQDRSLVLGLVALLVFMPLVRAIIQLTTTGTSGFLLGEPLQMLPLALGMGYLAFRVRVSLTDSAWTLLALFVAVAFLSAILSTHPYSALDGMAHYSLIMGLLFLLIPMLRDDPSLRQKLLMITLVAGVAYMLLFTLFFAAKSGEYGYPWATNMIGFRSIRHFGMLMALLAIIACLPLLRDKVSLQSKFLTGALLTLFTGFLFLSGGRGGSYALLIALFALIFLVKDGRLMRAGVIFIGLLLGLGLSTVIAPDGWSWGWQRALGLTSLDAPSLYAASSGRFDLWQETTTAVKSAPWFGAGAGVFPAFGGSIESDHPHNIFLQILVDWGVAGLGVVLAGFIVLSRRLWQGRHLLLKNTIAVLCLALLLYLGLHAVLSGALFMRFNLIVAGVALAVLLSKLPVKNISSKGAMPMRGLMVAAASWVSVTTLLAIWISVAPSRMNTQYLTKIPLLEMKVGSTAWRLDRIDKAKLSLSDANYDYLRAHCSEKSCLITLNSHQQKARP